MDAVDAQGFFVSDPRLSDCLYPDDEVFPHGCSQFIAAYDFMKEHMRVSGCEQTPPSETPLWAWHATDGRVGKPDLRTSMFRRMSTTCGEPMVLLHLEVPDDKVCLSDFQKWHYVLNGWYLETEDELEAVCLCAQNPGAPPYYYCGHVEQWLDEKHNASITEKRRSWLRIFDPSEFGDFVQGCFWRLEKDYILRVDECT